MKDELIPVLFHEFKHHIQSGRSFIIKNKNIWDIETERKLKTLGNSRFDYYSGKLIPEEIKCQISVQLQEKGVETKDEYIQWLGGIKEYGELKISDESVWTLRYVEQEKYIHIHPSRYSVNTLRIKAGTLKTILCFLLFEDELSYSGINKCRTEKLNLPPVNEKGKHRELEKIFELLNDKKS